MDNAAGLVMLSPRSTGGPCRVAVPRNQACPGRGACTGVGDSPPYAATGPGAAQAGPDDCPQRPQAGRLVSNQPCALPPSGMAGGPFNRVQSPNDCSLASTLRILAARMPESLPRCRPAPAERELVKGDYAGVGRPISYRIRIAASEIFDMKQREKSFQ